MLVVGFVLSTEESFLLGGSSIKITEIEKISSDDLDAMIAETPTSGSALVNAADLFAAYDSRADSYYISNMDETLTYSTGTDLYLSDEGDSTYRILAVKDDAHAVYAFTETGLPIMDIQSIMRNSDRRRVKARVQVFDEENRLTEYMLQYNIRGGTSRAYPKKSYSLHNTHDLPMTMLGLPANNKYAINSLYEDEYKMRDILSWDIYAQFKGTEPAMVYIEVFIDDQYRGLYGLQEYNNERRFGLNDTAGRIYEVETYGLPTEPPQGNNWEPIRLKYNNLEQSDRWDPMIDLVEILNMDDPDIFTRRANEILDMENFMDYHIFVEAIQARDNIWKNLFFTAQPGQPLQVQPWDLDMTFSGFMDQTEYDLNHVLVRLESGYPYPLHQLMRYHKTYPIDVAERYFELRDTVISTDNLVATADRYHGILRDTGALARDMERWPEATTIAEGREDHIQGWIIEHMDILDDHFTRVLAGETRG